MPAFPFGCHACTRSSRGVVLLGRVLKAALPQRRNGAVESGTYPKMFSVPDVLVVSVLALMLFGPDRLPKVMRQAGRFMREVQNTSHSFVAEMERAADANEPHAPPPPPEPPEPFGGR